MTDSTSSRGSISKKRLSNIVEIEIQHERTIMVLGENLMNFFIQLDRKPDNWEDRLTLFVGYLIENKRKCSYISAIKAVLKQDGIELCEDKYLLSSLTRVCRKKNDHIITHLPINKNLLVPAWKIFSMNKGNHIWWHYILHYSQQLILGYLGLSLSEFEGLRCYYSGGSKGGARDAPPLSAKISSFSCSFREKLGQ